jgi:transposase
LVAALTPDGMGPAMTLTGGVDHDAFEVYLEHFLCPTLRPGDYVLLDNLSVHKGARVQELIEATGATLRFLPPYSPDFNPIEHAFSKLKSILRRMAARTRDALEAAIAVALAAITAADAHGWFGHCGYPLAAQ